MSSSSGFAQQGKGCRQVPPKPGPTTAQDLFNWPINVVQNILAGDERMASNVINNFAGGISVRTFYSGRRASLALLKQNLCRGEVLLLGRQGGRVGCLGWLVGRLVGWLVGWATRQVGPILESCEGQKVPSK